MITVNPIPPRGSGDAQGDPLERIPDDEFPIHCVKCEARLPGDAAGGACPKCGHPYDRQDRLWGTYGPEAFAEPPITEEEQASSRAEGTFRAAFFASFGLLVLLPIGALVAPLLGRPFDLRLGLAVWALAAVIAAWLFVARRHSL
jgi:hypothetical protein